MLKSAIANAEQRADVNVDNLYVSKATVDGGPALKRFRPAPMGRAVRVLKRSWHLSKEHLPVTPFARDEPCVYL